MPLDSDVHNADEKLHVEFYTYDREPYAGRPFVRIIVPGDKTTVIDQPVREDHKQRFPRQWLFFQMKTEGGDIPGLPLEEWRKDRPQDLSEMQLSELQILKFRVVEQIATASDAQLQRIGMGAVGLRNLAQSYLREKRATQNASELDETKAKLAALEAQMAQLIAASEEKKRGPGRPPKEA